MFEVCTISVNLMLLCIPERLMFTQFPIIVPQVIILLFKEVLSSCQNLAPVVPGTAAIAGNISTVHEALRNPASESPRWPGNTHRVWRITGRMVEFLHAKSGHAICLTCTYLNCNYAKNCAKLRRGGGHSRGKCVVTCMSHCHYLAAEKCSLHASVVSAFGTFDGPLTFINLQPRPAGFSLLVIAPHSVFKQTRSWLLSFHLMDVGILKK